MSFHSRRISLTWLVGIVVGAIAFVVWEIAALVLVSKHRIDDQALKDQVTARASQSLESFFNSQLKILERGVLAYGAWDQFSEYLDTGENHEWFKRNIFPAVIQGGLRNSVEGVLILNKDLDVVVSHNPPATLRVADDIKRHPLVNTALSGKVNSSYMFSEGKLLKVAASPVTPTFDRSQISGVYMLTTTLNLELFSEYLGLGNTAVALSLPFDVTRVEWPPEWEQKRNIELPTFTQVLNAPEKFLQGSRLSDQEIAIPYFVSDYQGKTVCIAWIIARHPQIPELFSFVWNYTALACLVSLLVAMYAMVAMSAVVTKPLLAIISRMKTQRPSLHTLCSSSVIEELDALEKAWEELHVRNRNEQHVRRALMSAVEAGVLIFDAYTKVLEVNGFLSRLTGFAPQKFLDAADPFFFLNDSGGEACHNFMGLLDSENSLEKIGFNAALVCLDGSIKEVHVNLRVILRESDKIVVMVLTERSSEKSIELGERKLEKSRALAQFAAGVAHNMNNLLTSILGSVSLLSQSLREIDASTREKLINSIRRAASEGASLTKSMQQIALVREGHNFRRPVDVTKIVRDAIEMSLSVDAARRCQFITRLSASPLLALSEESGLHQVILNLILNAVDAMPHGGTISISVRAVQLEGRCVHIEVCDEGVGMGEELIGRIFDPFFTTKRGKKAEGVIGGSGLGLSSAQVLVESWGGTIECQSAVGVGTKFTIELQGVGEANILSVQ